MVANIVRMQRWPVKKWKETALLNFKNGQHKVKGAGMQRESAIPDFNTPNSDCVIPMQDKTDEFSCYFAGPPSVFASTKVKICGKSTTPQEVLKV